MTFSRIRSSGAWTDLSTVLSSEFEAIDANLSKAIDGDAGGAYAPTAEIVIGGAGMRFSVPIHFENGISIDSGGFLVTGPLLGHGTVDAYDAFRAHDTLRADGAATFNGTATFNDPVGFNDSVGFAAGVIIGGGFIVNGASGFNDAASFNDDVTIAAGHTVLVGSATTFQDQVALTGLTDVSSILTLSTHGRIRYRLAAATDNNATYSVNDYDAVFLPSNGILTSSKNWTIDDAGAQDGMRMELSRALDTDPAHTIFVKRSDTSTIVALHADSNQSCRIVRHGGTWKLFDTPLSV